MVVSRYQIVIFSLIVGVFVTAGFIAGQESGFTSRPKYDFDPSSYQEVGCNDIIRTKDGSLVCEVNLTEEDDNVRIFRGVYGTD